MQSLSIIGFGTFGQFIAPHLTPHFEVFAWSRTNYEEKASVLKVKWSNLDEALRKDIIIICTNISFFEGFLIENRSKFNPKALVIDVASVKMKPVQLMEKYLPATCEIVGTHPLFGPQSGKNGIEGLNFVLCPIRTTKAECIRAFASDVLKLNVLLRTPQEHDKEMAYVQGLTHFIARALASMDVKEYEMKTRAYERLLDVKNYLGGDSWELFASIENYNPFAKEVRTKFTKELEQLETKLQLEHLKIENGSMFSKVSNIQEGHGHLQKGINEDRISTEKEGLRTLSFELGDFNSLELSDLFRLTAHHNK